MNNHVLAYCKANFATSTDAEIISHCLETFGINVTTHEARPGLFLFKYDQLAAKWDSPVTHQSRGMILERKGGLWSAVSFPFCKFFNLGEPKCTITAEAYSSRPDAFERVSKEDGTCIQLYYYEEQWYASTLGTIVTADAYGYVSFGDLWWSTVVKQTGQSKDDFCKNLTRGITYIFELCTGLNRIVSRYPSDRVYLIGARPMKTLELLSQKALDQEAKFLGVLRPIFTNCVDAPTADALVELAEQESQIQRVDEPEYKEGFVLYEAGQPVAKIKNKKYLALHSVMGGQDPAYSVKSIIRTFFAGKLDDIIPALPDHFIAGVEVLQAEVSRLVIEVKSEAISIGSEISQLPEVDARESKKRYALRVQKFLSSYRNVNLKGIVSGFLYQHYEQISKNKEISISDYLIANVEKQVDLWKEIMLAEVLKKMKNYSSKE